MISSQSFSEMMPCLASMAAWTPLPRISCAIIRWSKRMEELKSSATGSVTPAVRPAHIFAMVMVSLRALSPQRTASLGSLRSVEKTKKNRKLATTRRYISVALFLKSPSAGVTRYPRPMEPGLSSRTGFRHVPATVRRTRRLYCSEAPPESQRKIQRMQKGEASVTMPLPPLSLTLSPACRCTSAKTVRCR